jgi:hypothetical protein
MQSQQCSEGLARIVPKNSATLLIFRYVVSVVASVATDNMARASLLCCLRRLEVVLCNCKRHSNDALDPWQI